MVTQLSTAWSVLPDMLGSKTKSQSMPLNYLCTCSAMLSFPS